MFYLFIFCSALFALYISFSIALIYGWQQLPAFHLEAHKQAVATSDKAFFTIIIPVRDEAENIEALLQDISRQTYTNFEVIVVDDQSSDGTADIVRNYADKASFRLRLLPLHEEVKKAHKKAAIRLAIEASDGDLITTTDGDCRVGENWLQAIHALYQQEKPMLISAGVTFHKLQSPFEKLQTVEFMSLIGAGAASMQLGAPNMCNGANLTYERKAFNKVGGFDGVDHLASGDDEFLMHKIHEYRPKGGVQFLKSKEAVVRTKAQPSLYSFIQQRKRWASKWNHYNNWKAIAVAVFVYVFHLATVGLMLGAVMLPPQYALWALVLLLLKVLVEYPYLRSILKFHGHVRILSYIWLTALIHSWYIVGIGIAGKVGQYQWKGRRI